MATRPKILYLTTLFPNTIDVGLAPFNRQQMTALARLATIDVVAPVPWVSALARPARLAAHGIGGLSVRHPCYFYLPGAPAGRARELPFSLSVKGAIGELARAGSYDRVLVSWLYPDGWEGARVSRKLNAPFYLKVHGTDVNRLSPGTRLAERSLGAASRAKKVICVSRALCERLTELGVPESKTALVYNGVDMGIFFRREQALMRRRLSIAPGTKLILYVGNLKPDKGLYELGEALALLRNRMAGRDLCLAVLGDGPLMDGWKRELVSLGVDGLVKMVGRLPLESIAEWMSACDVLCLPSHREGMPNVLLEGTASGARIVATSVGGIPELASVTGNITLVPPHSAQMLAQALLGALSGEGGEMGAAHWPSWEESAENLARALDLDVSAGGGPNA